MKATVLIVEARAALKTAAKFVAHKTTLPVLECVCIVPNGAFLLISATNLDRAVVMEMPAFKIEKEGEGLCLPGKRLSELIDVYPPSGFVDMSFNKDTAQLSAGTMKNSVKGMPVSEFPLVKTELEGATKFTVAADKLIRGLKDVVETAATNDSRLILPAVHFKIGKTTLNLVSADGYRLGVHTIDVNSDVEGNINVPRKVVEDLIPLLPSGDELVQVIFTDSQVMFEFRGLNSCDTWLTAQLVEGQFLDYQAIVPKETTYTVEVLTSEIERAVRAANVFARESSFTGRFHVDAVISQMIVSGVSAETGQSVVGVGVAVTKPEEAPNEFDIAFNLKYMQDFLKVAGTQRVKMEFTTPASPGVFRPVERNGMLHVIMPMHTTDHRGPIVVESPPVEASSENLPPLVEE